MPYRGFGLELIRDGKDDSMEFSASQTCQSHQKVGPLVDDGVGVSVMCTASESNLRLGEIVLGPFRAERNFRSDIAAVDPVQHG